MSRWASGGRERLELAALELFVERGFAETTVPEIAARAGLTTRTFFRHFADKREVLFAGENDLPELVAHIMADTPASLSPMQLIAQGLDLIATTRFEGQLDKLRIRRAIVQTDEGLRERELHKLSILFAATRKGFLERGLDELTATMAAQIAVTIFSVGVDRWLDQVGEQPLSHHLDIALRALGSVIMDTGD